MAYSFDTELKNVASKYALLLDANVTSSTIQKEIEEHPFYPSLLSLSDVYGRYNLKNEAYNINKEGLDELAHHTPFIAYVNFSNTKDFVIVKEITEQLVIYVYKNGSEVKIGKEKFLNIFREVIFLAEKINDNNELYHKINVKSEKAKKNQRKAIYLLGILLFLYVIFSADFNYYNLIQFGSIFLIKSFGISVSVLLLLFEVDKNNAFVNQICTINKKANCDAVLSSRASKFLGISWTDIGIVYFISTTILLLTPSSILSEKFSLITIANSLAVPYIIFSIYYQAIIVKQWCILCLSVQALLLLELTWSFLFIWDDLSLNLISMRSMLFVIFSVYMPFMLLYILKPILMKSKDHDLYKSAYKRLQYNPDIFHNLLSQQPVIKEGWDNLGITLGSSSANNIIVKVCNPYCTACDKSHEKITELLENNPNIKLQIIYINANSDLDTGTPVVKYLLAIASEGNMKRTKNAINDWYLRFNKDFSVFSNNYPLKNENTNFDDNIEKMSKWCRSADVMYTPTIFINGHRLPEQYDVSELKYLL